LVSKSPWKNKKFFFFFSFWWAPGGGPQGTSETWPKTQEKKKPPVFLMNEKSGGGVPTPKKKNPCKKTKFDQRKTKISPRFYVFFLFCLFFCVFFFFCFEAAGVVFFFSFFFFVLFCGPTSLPVEAARPPLLFSPPHCPAPGGVSPGPIVFFFFCRFPHTPSRKTFFPPFLAKRFFVFRIPIFSKMPP